MDTILAPIKSMKKYISRKNILITIFFLILIALYFFLMYKILKPNILTWWSDEYEYVSQARNFALFSKLEASFYSAKAALYGKFPSFGYHPILFSFLMGLFLKIFKGNPNATFTFNYFLSFLILITMYFYSKQRIEKRLSIYPILLVALFPIMLIYSNTQATEVFFMLLVPLIYLIFYKNQLKFNPQHFIILLLLSIISCQRFTYLIIAVTLLPYIYFNWLKNKKVFYFLSSVTFFISSYLLLFYIFNSDTQLYLAEEKIHVLQYFKYYGIPTLLNKESWIFFYQHVLENLNNLSNFFLNISSNYFLFHWLLFGIIFFNLFLLFKTKDKILKKELALFLIPQCLLLIAGATLHVTKDLGNFSHLRPAFGFIPLNLFYLFILIKKLKFKIRNIFLVFFVPIFILSSFFTIKPFYLKKIEACSNQNVTNIQSITSAMEKYSYKKDLIISGIDDIEMPIRNYIVYSNSGDKFVRTNQFQLTNDELKKYMDKIDTDIWITKNNDPFIINQLHKWPFRYNINGNKDWVLFITRDAFPMIPLYRFDSENFQNFWEPLNNCEFIIENNEIIINAFGNDPYFESIIPFDFNDSTNYYIEVKLISPEPSYLQIFNRYENSNYNEGNSSKLLTIKGGNYFITKLTGNIIRIDPGTMKGIYIIKEISIYCSKY